MTSQHFYYVLIATLITVVIWFASSVFHNDVTSKDQVPPNIQQLTEDIKPNLDENNTINGLTTN